MMKWFDQQSDHQWGISSGQCLVHHAGDGRASGGMKATQREQEVCQRPIDLGHMTQPVCGNRITLESVLLLQLLHQFDVLVHRVVVALAWWGRGKKVIKAADDQRSFWFSLGRSFHPAGALFKRTINDAEWRLMCVITQPSLLLRRCLISTQPVVLSDRSCLFSLEAPGDETKFFPSTCFHPLHCSLAIDWLQVNSQSGEFSQSRSGGKVTKNCTKRRDSERTFLLLPGVPFGFPREIEHSGTTLTKRETT